MEILSVGTELFHEHERAEGRWDELTDGRSDGQT